MGCARGDFRVTRGGSHSTTLEYLRSANRSGTLPEDRSWLIGFRVVQGEMPQTKPLEPPRPPLAQRDVKQAVPPDLARGPDPKKPYFKGPRPYVKIPPGSEGPLFSRHNHDPAIAECPNGDLLAIWYTCRTEPGASWAWRPAGSATGPTSGSRPRPSGTPRTATTTPRPCGSTAWTRSTTSTACRPRPPGAANALVMRTSKDNGATWSPARLIAPEHGMRHQPVESVFRTREGFILLPCDAVPGGAGGTAIHLSRDGAHVDRPGRGPAAARVRRRQDGGLDRRHPRGRRPA